MPSLPAPDVSMRPLSIDTAPELLLTTMPMAWLPVVVIALLVTTLAPLSARTSMPVAELPCVAMVPL